MPLKTTFPNFRLSNTAWFVLLGLICARPGLAASAPTAPAVAALPKYHVSTVASNGMPKNIVARGSLWNFGSGALWTHRGWQYAAYWDAARQVSVARRQLPSGSWAVVSLPGYQRTETENRGKGGAVSRGFGDGHEKVAMGISPDGVIHLAFDHHVSTLHYRRTKIPVANDPAAHAWNADLFGPVQDTLGGLDGPGVCYDDLKDRFQTNNLVGNAECASLLRQLDERLQAQLIRIGDDFRPGKDYLAEWNYEVAAHGSVPYAAGITKVQTPWRNPALPTPKSRTEKPASTTESLRR